MSADLIYIYACFRCGHEPIGISTEDEDTISKCPDCGDKGVVSAQMAYDILNKLYLKGVSLVDDEEDSDYDAEEYNEMDLNLDDWTDYDEYEDTDREMD